MPNPLREESILGSACSRRIALIGLSVLLCASGTAFADGPDLTRAYGIEIRDEGTEAPVTERAEGHGAVTLSLPLGRHAVYVWQGNQSWRCTINVSEGQNLKWKPSDCRKLFRRRDSRTRWAIELGGAEVTSVVDNYSVALLDAGYEGVGPKQHQRMSGTFFFGTRSLKTGIEVSTLEKKSGVRMNPTTGAEETVSWASLALILKSRASMDVSHFFLRRSLRGLAMEAFAELGVGLSVARTRFQAGSLEKKTDYGPLLQAGIGVAYVFPHGIGVYVKIDFIEATTIDDFMYGEHDIGGTGLGSGFRIGW